MEPRPRILIVDDEPFNLDYLEQELDDLGYDSLTAANGPQALELVAQEQPDMLLLDIMMPGMDGFEVLRRLKAAEEWRDIPVVIISALADMDSIVRGIELGAEDYLPKPFNPLLLNARLTAGLGRKRLHDLEKQYLHSLERELEIGHRIQAGFLPDGLPEVPGWSLAAHFQAAREVAGDFYDAFFLPDGRLGFFLGDVTDKGVGAALFMALYRSLLRAFLNVGSDLLGAVLRTNQYVCQTHTGALFATLFIGALDPGSGELVFINAGHNPPHITLNGSFSRSLHVTGPGLGILEEMDFQVARERLAPGEMLFIFSDGAEDTQNSTGEFFGFERLCGMLASGQASAPDCVARVAQELERFRGEASPYDDVTLFAVQRVFGKE
jgi:sigma-B regulation protein RsbU (phosphoserine phosphatase)